MGRRAVLASGIAAVLPLLAAFAAIAAAVRVRAPLVGLDERITQWVYAHQQPALTAFLVAVTHLHSTFGVLVMSALFIAVLIGRGERYWATMVAAVVPCGLALNAALKDLFQRGRPVLEEPLLVPLTTYSFPSGHTAGATLFYGVLAAYLWPRLKTRAERVACVLGAAFMVALVGFSRLYLGVHYLSDVLAAVCASGGWLALCLTVGTLFRERRRAA